MSKIKVLMFGWELAPVITGGLGVVCRDLTDALTLKDVDITFVIPKLPQEIVLDNFKIINASNYRLSQKQWKSIAIESCLIPYQDEFSWLNIENAKNHIINNKFDTELYGMNLISEVERYTIIAREISKKIECDIIHAHDWMTALAAIEAKKVLHKPFILHIHSTEYDRTAGWPNPMIINYEKIGLNSADKIIAISQYSKNILIEKFKINPDKIVIVHNAINKPFDMKNDEKDDNKEKIVLFLARLSVQKGADYLLKAAQKVLTVKKNVKFVIVGKGPMLKTLIDLAFTLGINDNVIFTGALSHEQVDNAYKQADLFVMPSVSEPFGLTCLEAIKNGTPVIISKQSGVSEVINNCLKVDYWDTDMMASKIISILNHESLRNTLTENGLNELKELTWEKQADKVIRIYQEFV